MRERAKFQGGQKAPLILFSLYQRDKQRKTSNNDIPFQKDPLRFYKPWLSYKQDREVLLIIKDKTQRFGMRGYKIKERGYKDNVMQIITKCRGAQPQDAINFLLMTEHFLKDGVVYTISPFLDICVGDIIANIRNKDAGSTMINHLHMISIIKQVCFYTRFLFVTLTSLDLKWLKVLG